MRLKQYLLEELRSEIPEHLLELIPSRYPIIGDIMLIRLDPALRGYGKVIGKKILRHMDGIKSVWAIYETRRACRVPKVELLAGDKNPVTTHKELETYFQVDISRLTFSPGNSNERRKLIEIVDDGEVILDMFACVGNLSLPIATNRDPALIHCLEINPYVGLRVLPLGGVKI